MIEFKHTHSNSDCTNIYDVILDKEYTVEEFINDRLKNNPNEWGEFNIIQPGIKQTSINYKYGEINKDEVKPFNSTIIERVTAVGGWSAMTYNITTN